MSVDRYDNGMEIDLLAVNETEAVLVEVKSRLAITDVEAHLARLINFKRLLPR